MMSFDPSSEKDVGVEPGTPLPESPTRSHPPPIPVREGKLHPLSLLFTTVDYVRGLLIPAIVLYLAGNEKLMAFVLILVFFPRLATAIARYFTFTYRLTSGELQTREGIFSKKERNIALNRIQDIRIEQGLLHRFFKMATVQIETAGGRGAEATLSVLAATDAENLRAAIFELRGRTKVSAEVSQQPELSTRILKQLSLRDLMLAGLTSNRTASALAMVVAVLTVGDDFFPKAFERWNTTIQQAFETVVKQGPEQAVIVMAAVLVVVLGASIVLSIIGSIVLFYGFTLSRQGENLKRAYGLFTRRGSSLSRQRIQVLKIEEGLLRRLFRLAALRADTAGSAMPGGGQNGGHDVLIPALPMLEVKTLLPEILPRFKTDEPQWHRVASVAVWRSSLIATFWLALLTGFLVYRFGIYANFALLLVPVVIALQIISYRNVGYAVDEEFFQTREGWIKRETYIVPLSSIQTISIRQSPIDRALGVVSLTVDTAGQAVTGGTPRISNILWPAAEPLVIKICKQAAEKRFRIKNSPTNCPIDPSISSHA